MSVPLTTRLDDPDAVAYFTWDDPMTVREIRTRLATASAPERDRLLAKILREARDTDVWTFTTLDVVRANWARIEPMLGRRRSFWTFLLDQWALAGFHLGHRTTHDLDLFTTTDRLDHGAAALRDAAADVRATLESVLASPHHRRFLVRRGSEGLVVDLVHDPTPQGTAEKALIEGIRVDPASEIMANKLCTLLSRTEVRDIVDVMALERAGLSVESALPLAQRKDAGLTPAQLAWVLSRVRFGADARVPEGTSRQELESYLSELAGRLARLARPG